MPCALPIRSEEHTSELQSHDNIVCRLMLEKKQASSCDSIAQNSPSSEAPPGAPGRRRCANLSLRAPRPAQALVRGGWLPLALFLLVDVLQREQDRALPARDLD